MLKFEINGQKMTRVDTFAPATDSKGYLKASFSFSSDWAGATKTAIFRDELTGESYEAPLNSSGICTVPAEVLTRSTAIHYQTQGNHFHVSIRGDIGAVLVTTNEVKVELARSGYTEGQTPAAPTPDAYSQFVAEVKTDADRAAGSAEAAATSERNVANLYANALKKTARGEIVAVSDVSPVEHELGVWVHGKNLLKPMVKENAEGATSETWQCTAEVAADGKITLTNTVATNGVAYARVGTVRLRKGQVYTFSRKDASNVLQVLLFYKGTTTLAAPTTLEPFTPTHDVVADLAVYMADVSAVGNTTSVYLQVEEGATATEYEPYIDPTAVTVTRCGKNLLPKRTTAGTNAGNGVTQKMNVDGSVSITGTATAPAYLGIENIYNLPKGVYCVSGNTSAECLLIAGAYNGDTYIFEAQDRGEGVVLDLTDKTFDHVRLMMYVPQGITVSKTIYPMLSTATSGTEYEKPAGTSTHTPAADGTVEGVKSLSPNMTLLTDTPGVTIEATYHRDLVKVIEALEAALN